MVRLTPITLSNDLSLQYILLNALIFYESLPKSTPTSVSYITPLKTLKFLIISYSHNLLVINRRVGPTFIEVKLSEYIQEENYFG